MTSAEIRAEIEQILIEHPRTRAAKVLIGMRNGLSDADMAAASIKEDQPINAESPLPIFWGAGERPTVPRLKTLARRPRAVRVLQHCRSWRNFPVPMTPMRTRRSMGVSPG